MRLRDSIRDKNTTDQGQQKKAPPPRSSNQQMPIGSVKNVTRRGSPNNGKVTKSTLKKDHRRSTGMLKNKLKTKGDLAMVFIEAPSTMDKGEEKTGKDNSQKSLSNFRTQGTKPLHQAPIRVPINHKRPLSAITEQEEKEIACSKNSRYCCSMNMNDLLPITSIDIPIIPQIKQQQQPIIAQKTELSSVLMHMSLSEISEAAINIMYDIISNEEDEEEEEEKRAKQKETSIIINPSAPQIAAMPAVIISSSAESLDSKSEEDELAAKRQRVKIKYPIKNTRKRKCDTASIQQQQQQSTPDEHNVTNNTKEEIGSKKMKTDTQDNKVHEEQVSKRKKTESHVKEKKFGEDTEVKEVSVEEALEQDSEMVPVEKMTINTEEDALNPEKTPSPSRSLSGTENIQMESTKNQMENVEPIASTNDSSPSTLSKKAEEEDEGIVLDSNTKEDTTGIERRFMKEKAKIKDPRRSTRLLLSGPLGCSRKDIVEEEKEVHRRKRKTEMTPQILPPIKKSISSRKSSTGKTSYKEKSDSKVRAKSPAPTRKRKVKTAAAITGLPSQYLKNKSILHIRQIGQQINPSDLVVMDTLLGEGQIGRVSLAKYKGLLVACKCKRGNTSSDLFNFQIYRELKFAAKLSVCRYINRYIGWTYCTRRKVEERNGRDCSIKKVYVIQRYVSNCDARTYLDNRDAIFQPIEVLQASICLFSALSDAHKLDIGIVDLKLENFLIDCAGSGWLTDFGSCIEFDKRKVIDLDKEEVSWTMNVAAPEMISSNSFSKASDVFMACLIIAELLTVDLSDDQFNDKVLNRNEEDGSVNFSSWAIHDRYKSFFSVLKLGLANEPEKRPTASKILNYLLEMKKQA